MKLSNTDIDILKILIEQNLKRSEVLQMDSEDHFKPEILQQISKKLDRMYFQ